MFLARPVLRFSSLPARRFNSTTTSAPPLLATIRNDLKTAMRAKDTNRLNVLRSLLAEITIASKTPSPPTTDLHILAIINKTKTKSLASISEFRAAGREDLVAKEEGQVVVLEEYVKKVATVGREEIETVVRGVVEGGMGGNMGEVIKEVLKVMEGKPVVKAEVAAVVKNVMTAK
ncbi:hypothetical protein RUND412_006277 [Rhizina undulata]